MYFHPDPLKVIGWMAQPATPMFSLLLSTWTWDTFLTLRGTQGFYLNHVLPLRLSRSYRHSQLYSGTASYIVAQPATPIFSLSLSNWTWDTFLTLRGTQGFYLNHVLPPRPSKSYRVDGTAGYMVAQPAIWWMAQPAIWWHSRLYGGGP